MPTYRITNPETGQVIKMTGDTPPTQADIDNAFKAVSGNGTVSQTATQPKTIQGFGENILKSGARAVGDIANAAVNTLNPNMDQNTLVNAGKIASGIQSYTPSGFIGRKISETISPQSKQMFQEGDEAFKQVRDFYGERYGSPQRAYDTIYDDPVGVAMDVSTVAGGVGAVGGTSRVGRIANTVSRVTDPIQAVGVASKPIFKRIPTKVGTAVEDFGKDYGVKSTRISQLGQNAFSRTGESLPDYLARTNLYGQDLKAVDNYIAPMQDRFDTATIASGKTIPKRQLTEQLRAKANELLYDESGLPTMVEDNINIAQQLREQADKIDNLPQDNIGLDYLTRERRRIDDVTPQAQFDKSGNFSKRTRGDVYRNVLNTEAGTTELGKELNKAYKFRSVLEKAPKGKGNLPLGLNKGVWANVLDKVPLIGPAVGIGIETVANNPRFIGATSKALQKTGSALKGNSPIFKRTSNVLSKGYKIGKAGRIVNSGNEKTTEEPTVRQQILPTNSDFKPIYKRKKQSIDFSLL